MLPRNPRDVAALPRRPTPEHLRRPAPVHIPPISMDMSHMEQLSAGTLPSYEEGDTLDRDPEKLLLDEKVNLHLNNLHSQMVLAITTFTEEVEPTINSPSLMMVVSDDGEKVLDWTGPDDPGNPRNWAFGKKVFHTLIPSLFGFILTLATSIYVPCTVAVEEAFGVSRELSNLGLAFYTIGFVVGPLVTAPLSEIVGRYWIYVVSLPVFMAFTAGAGAAQNLVTLCVCRFCSSVGGSAALAIGAGTIVELWDPAKEGAIASVLFTIAPFVGPAIGPLTGAYIIADNGGDWRWAFWITIIVSAPVALGATLMNETSKKQILNTRYRKATGRKAPKKAGPPFVRALLTNIRRPLHMVTVEPLVMLISIYTGFAFAMMFSFFSSFPYIFVEVYHFNLRNIGLAFCGLLPGFLLAFATFGYFDATVYKKKAAMKMATPEHRLCAAMFGSFMLPIGLFWFAWTPREGVHWIWPILAAIPFAWGMLAIFLSAIVYLIEVYGAATGASALAANGVLRYGLGAVFPLFTTQLYQSLSIQWAGTLFASVSLLLMPIPWIFFFYGRSLRQRSSYDCLKH